ncbi:hypothetical protein O4J56_13450 [Nocardiopsis sp. RSe5-2]|uniref:Uncharacterized protein n=1 Tax=Nocardiopsis endophytica TaxID=3018445 RepID=A0ABT4U4K3_9ACTN|nr:hypothetical protein [Nocardiopsis endophytica]MDA2811641.1 hypothetical protein [Nocardiopsis endophytica]
MPHDKRDFHHPGRPSDLPAPGMLWAHGVIEHGARRIAPDRPWSEFSFGPEGMHHVNLGGCWWQLTWVEGDRAVLTGYEPLEDTIDAEVDLFGGGPDWLPWEWLDAHFARYRRDDMGVSFLYWWDGAWARTDYPAEIEDDGLVTVGGFGTPEGLLVPEQDLLDGDSPFRVEERALALGGELMACVADRDGERAWELFLDLLRTGGAEYLIYGAGYEPDAPHVDVDAARDGLGADWFTRRATLPAGAQPTA